MNLNKENNGSGFDGKIAKYYRIVQDRSIDNTPAILNYTNNIIHRRDLTEEASILYIKEDKNAQINYVDFIDKPLLLVSEEFKKVIKMYNKGFTFRAVVLTEKVSGTQTVYWNIDMPEGNCLSDKTVIGHDQLISKVAINESKACDNSMIKISNKLKTIYVVRRDLAESALRRKLCGFTLEELESE